MEKRKINTLVVHQGADEVAATTLLMLVCRELLGDSIATAPIKLADSPNFTFWDKTPNAKSPQGEDVLTIGCLGGPLDEHGKLGYLKRCAALEVAEFLCVHNNPAIKLFLAQVIREDRQRQGDPLEVAKVFKHVIRYQRKKMTDMEIFDWAFTAYWAELSDTISQVKRGDYNPRKNLVCSKAETLIRAVFGDDRADKWKAVAEESLDLRRDAFEQGCEYLREEGAAKIDFTPGGLKVVLVSSDNPEISAASRHVLNHDIIVRHTPATGHVVILTNQRKQIDLCRLLLALRRAEHEQRGIPLPAEALLTMKDDPRWPHWDGHVIENGFGKDDALSFVCAAYNGTDLTASGIQPTALPPELIFDGVLAENPPALWKGEGGRRRGFHGSKEHSLMSGRSPRHHKNRGARQGDSREDGYFHRRRENSSRPTLVQAPLNSLEQAFASSGE